MTTEPDPLAAVRAVEQTIEARLAATTDSFSHVDAARRDAEELLRSARDRAIEAATVRAREIVRDAEGDAETERARGREYAARLVEVAAAARDRDVDRVVAAVLPIPEPTTAATATRSAPCSSR